MAVHEENGLSRIFADDPIFSSGEAFAEELMLGPNPFKNHCRLAQGYCGFPLLILMNPCDRHTEDFGDMFTKHSALLWLRRFFADIGLNLEYDVPILDMFPYLSDHWLRQNMNGKHAETHELILRSCDITQKLVEYFNPAAIIVMHCATNPHAAQRHPFFGGVQHPLAESLSSSMEEAGQERTQTLNIRGREIPVIRAFHPNRINYETDWKERRRLTAMLRGILSEVFGRFMGRSEGSAQSGF